MIRLYRQIVEMRFYRKLSTFAHSSNANALLLFEVVCGLVISGLSFVFFIDITKDVLEKEVLFIDTIISQFIYSFRTPFLTDIFRFISFLGGKFLILSCTLMVGFLVWKKHKRETILFSFTILVGLFLNNVIKIILQVPRPNISPIYAADSYSFPSGHAMNSFIFYALLSYFMFHFTRRKKLSILFSIAAMSLVILIGLSRVYLGVHYPSDIIAGFIGGFWWFITVVLINKTIIFYKMFREKGDK